MGMEKVIIGAVLIIVSLYYIGTNTFNALHDLKVVVNGALPLFVFILGAIIVWLQLDEIATEKKVSRKR